MRTEIWWLLVTRQRPAADAGQQWRQLALRRLPSSLSRSTSDTVRLLTTTACNDDTTSCSSDTSSSATRQRRFRSLVSSPEIKCPSVWCQRFQTLRLQDHWADVNETWHIYFVGRGTKLLGSGILILATTNFTRLGEMTGLLIVIVVFDTHRQRIRLPV